MLFWIIFIPSVLLVVGFVHTIMMSITTLRITDTTTTLIKNNSDVWLADKKTKTTGVKTKISDQEFAVISDRAFS